MPALRRRATKAERVLQKALEDNGVRFKFQMPFYSVRENRLFIADFCLRTGPTERLIVEVDGSSHKGREAYDAARTCWLEANRSCRVMRFTNEQVITDCASVVCAILSRKPYLDDGSEDEARVVLDSAPICAACKKPQVPKWRTYRNGAVHLVWWCCGRQRNGNPIPSGLAPFFGLPTRATIEMRNDLETDQSWADEAAG